MVVKRDGRREPFDSDKIRFGIRKACEKRPVAADAQDRLVEDVTREVFNTLASEVTTRTSAKTDEKAEGRGRGRLRPLRLRLPRVQGHADFYEGTPAPFGRKTGLTGIIPVTGDDPDEGTPAPFGRKTGLTGIVPAVAGLRMRMRKQK